MVKFEMNMDSRIQICPDLNIIWTDKFTSLGIDYDVTELEYITELNLKFKILEIEKSCKLRQLLSLTLIGKINIIKSLFTHKIIHILLSLPSPKER